MTSRFVLRRPLGRGGMGEVWLAEDLERGRPAALKFLAAGLGDAARRRALLEHEAGCMSRIEHPAVARVIGCFDHDGEPFLAVDAVLAEAAAPPGSLAGLRGAPPQDWIVPVLAVADALAAVHAAGVVHRDVKASNVLIDHAGRATVVDFGIAAALADATPAQALRSGGSPTAMSPQQRAGEAPSPADDVHAFGALLHELALGRAPSPQRRQPADAAGEAPLPAALLALIERCLAPEPADRPAGMREVHDELARIAAADLDTTRPPAGLGDLRPPERIRPVTPHNAALESLASSSRRARGVPWRVLASVSAVWMLVLAGVLFARLPVATPPLAAGVATGAAGQPAEGDGSEAGGNPGGREAAGGEQRIAAPLEYARLRREREEVLDDVNRFLDLQQRLEEQAVARWGGEAWTAALATAEAGDARFRENDFTGAAQAYGEAESALLALEAQAPEAAAAALDAGRQALARGDGETAVAQFELALAIDPSLQDAAEGLERAQRLDEVTALLASAREAAAAGNLRLAVERYEEALALDPAREDARESLGRLRAQLSGTRFDELMSRGFAALEAGDFAAARRAFTEAGRLRSGAGVVRDALAQVDVGERGERIAGLRREAERHAQAEEWKQALEAYEAVLAIDPSLTFARQGSERAQRMAELHERLTYYASDALRLTDTSVRGRAAEVLQQAQALADPGPRLVELRERLARVLDEVTRPVTVRLESDNRTSVRILRAADLGRFEAREVALRPGRYTIVGTREGYRDVREEITVLGGERSPVVVVRCTEKI